MKVEYDFDGSRANPYVKKLRKPVTMNLDVDVIEYFKEESARTGVPYQTIINLFLAQCVEEGRHLTFSAGSPE